MKILAAMMICLSMFNSISNAKIGDPLMEVVGDYKGMYTVDNMTFPVVLRIVPVNVLTTSKDEKRILISPSVGGSITDESNVVMVEFNFGKFEPSTQRLILSYFDEIPGTASQYLDGSYRKGHISGKLYSLLNSNRGTIDVQKVK